MSLKKIPIHTLVLLIFAISSLFYSFLTFSPRKVKPSSIPNLVTLSGTTWYADTKAGKPILGEIGFFISDITFSQMGKILVVRGNDHPQRSYLPLISEKEGCMLFLNGANTSLRLTYEKEPVKTVCITSLESKRKLYFLER